MKALLSLTLTAAISVSAGLSFGEEAPQSALAKLAQSSAVYCQPSLPVFCSNIHVTCSGPSNVKTFAFTLRAGLTQGSIESAADTSGITEQYDNAPTEWEGTYVILRPRQANGYIKLLADSTYSFRHYSRGAGTMSRGRCN